MHRLSLSWLTPDAKVIIKLETDKKLDKKMANDIIRNYMRYLKLERNYTYNTLEAYRHDLEYLMEYARQNDVALVDMKLENLENFSASLHDKGMRCPLAGSHPLWCALLYRYLVTDGYIKDDPTELLPSPQIGRTFAGISLCRGGGYAGGCHRSLEMGRAAQQGYHRNPFLLRTCVLRNW